MANKKFTKFDWNTPKIVATLLKGKDAERLYNEIQSDNKKFGKNSNLGFIGYQNGEVVGSTSLRSGQINYKLRNSGIRTAVPEDDVGGDIFNLIRGKGYTDFNAYVVHNKKPNYKKNEGLWVKTNELIEKINGSVPAHSMIQSFYTLPDKNEMTYGVKIIPTPNFKIFDDDRVSGKYHRWRFDNVDEKGLPINLDKSKGKKTFYTRDEGLSRVFLDGNGGLNVWGDSLEYSNDGGRVVAVSDA